MKKKKISALILSAVMALSVVSFMPESVTYADQVMVDDTFEVNYDGWCNMGDFTKLTADVGAAHDSLRGMKVENRQSPEDGAYSEKGFYLGGGTEYNYSVYVYHNEDDNETFKLNLTYLYSDGETYETQEILSQEVAPGEWTKLTTDYTAPAGTVNLTIKITTDSVADFFFDDVVVVGKEKVSSDSVDAADSSVGLKDVYANYFRFGTCLSSSGVSNSQVQALVIKEFNSVTCGK